MKHYKYCIIFNQNSEAIEKVSSCQLNELRNRYVFTNIWTDLKNKRLVD